MTSTWYGLNIFFIDVLTWRTFKEKLCKSEGPVKLKEQDPYTLFSLYCITLSTIHRML